MKLKQLSYQGPTETSLLAQTSSTATSEPSTLIHNEKLSTIYNKICLKPNLTLSTLCSPENLNLSSTILLLYLNTLNTTPVHNIHIKKLDSSFNYPIIIENDSLKDLLYFLKDSLDKTFTDTKIAAYVILKCNNKYVLFSPFCPEFHPDYSGHRYLGLNLPIHTESKLSLKIGDTTIEKKVCVIA